MDIVIRKLKPIDLNSYRELRLQCLKNYPMHFTANYDDEKEKEKLFFHDSITNADTNNFMIGAFSKGSLIGFSGFNRYNRTKVAHKGRIIQVYVKPNYQGQQIGYSIVKATIEEAFQINDIELIEIDAIASNTSAKKLYTKLGFMQYGIQKHFLKVNGIYYDHVMMMLFKKEFK
ncbi:GNAT family N-acetyltransferase [Winogradskyella sp. PE311]|uniref:GNAT family N-acetyltransferase n=1 Tax=Winogradskyella sp. PE311 TaxID=3366943 RepID=UPI00397F6261